MVSQKLLTPQRVQTERSLVNMVWTLGHTLAAVHMSMEHRPVGWWVPG